MADPFVAEIRIFPFNFAPKNWALCNGQLLPLSQNTMMFSLLGTFYGGDGKSVFALPDLEGRAPMHPGDGPGLSLHDLGESLGSENVTLFESQLPAHSHALGVWQNQPADHFDPSGKVLARSNSGQAWGAATSLTAMAPEALTPAGGGQPHNNLMPYLTFNFCISLLGVYPPRG